MCEGYTEAICNTINCQLTLHTGARDESKDNNTNDCYENKANFNADTIIASNLKAFRKHNRNMLIIRQLNINSARNKLETLVQ